MPHIGRQRQHDVAVPWPSASSRRTSTPATCREPGLPSHAGSANGQPINFGHAERGKANNTVELNAGGHPTAYLSDLTCAVRVSAAP